MLVRQRRLLAGGSPDTVYLGGSFNYNTRGTSANGRALLRSIERRGAAAVSTDAGATWSDLTRTAIRTRAPNGIHPDQHAIVVDARQAEHRRSSARTAASSARAASSPTSRPSATRGARTRRISRYCQSLLSAVPTQSNSMNRGLSTLQFQSLSVSPQHPTALQGGTQDNGTWREQRARRRLDSDHLRRRRPVRLQRRRTRPALQHVHRAGERRELPRTAIRRSGCHRRRPIITSPEGAYFYPPVHRGSETAQTAARSSRDRSASGGRRTGAATRRSWRRTAPSSRRRPRQPALRRLRADRAAAQDEPHGTRTRPTTAAATAPAATSPRSSGPATRARSGRRPVPAVCSSRTTRDAPAAVVVWQRIDNLPGATTRPGPLHQRRSTSTRRIRITPGSRTRATTSTRRRRPATFSR